MKNNIYDIKELGFVPPKYGGVSVSIARLIDKLTADGFVVGGFYSKDNSDPAVLQSSLYEPELNLSTKRLLKELPRCFKILRPYKVLHSHYSLENMIYMWFFLVFMRKKIVITVHNSMVQRFYQDCDVINRFFLKRVANSPDVTWVAVSEQAKAEMLKLPIKYNNSIQVIPAYIPDGQAASGELPHNLRDYIERHNKIIVFYGHSFMLHDGKDVYGFNDALSLYAEILKLTHCTIGFVLCLTETNDSNKINILQDKAHQLGVDDKIYWQFGPIEGMTNLWNNTDVYVRPTCTDGDSVAVREALDLGVQVVASDVCPRPERTILYRFGDMSDFVGKVASAIEIGHVEANPDYGNYYKLKNIYSQLLDK